MNSGKTIFSQIMDFLLLHEFRKCVRCYRGDYKVKSFSCLDQFLCMAFAQITYRESLRDIETCLRSMQNKLYYRGIRGKVFRNTLAHANEKRNGGSKQEALIVLQEEIQKAFDRKYSVKRKKEKTSFKDFAPIYIEDYAKLKKRSWRSDEKYLRVQLVPFFGETRLSEIGALDVQKFMAKRLNDCVIFRIT